jgi:hypothetical protein
MEKQVTKDSIQWDIKSWSKALEYWYTKLDWDKINCSLELGGREGGLSIWLALKGKKTLCSDIKEVKNTTEQLHILYSVAPSPIFIYNTQMNLLNLD